MSPRRFALLDRDGTIIAERHYLADPQGVELLPRAAEGLRALRALGLGLVVVTNQSGIARGYFDARRLEEIHARLSDLLAAESVELDGIYVCPHGPDDGCTCRKPLPGLVRKAASDLAFDPRESFVIGDKACDVELGCAVGATALLVRTGYGEAFAREYERSDRLPCAPGGAPRPHFIATDLPDAARMIAGALRSGAHRHDDDGSVDFSPHVMRTRVD